MSVESIRATIATLAEAAMCGDWEHGSAPSVLRTMGKDALQANDVPAALEMVALLQHFTPAAHVRVVPASGLETVPADVELEPGVVWSDANLLLLVNIPESSFEDVAYWVADRLPSAKVKALPGVLALPFTVESVEVDGSEQAVLFPDWFSVFYPHGMAHHAVPILTLRSVLANGAFGGDWVDAAVGRMGVYGLPRESAEKFVADEIARRNVKDK